MLKNVKIICSYTLNKCMRNRNNYLEISFSASLSVILQWTHFGSNLRFLTSFSLNPCLQGFFFQNEFLVLSFESFYKICIIFFSFFASYAIIGFLHFYTFITFEPYFDCERLPYFPDHGVA